MPIENPNSSNDTTEPNRTVLVAGASGRTGREILRELRRAPLYVRALTRSASKRESLLADGVDEVVVGDLLNPADARGAVENCEAVLFAAGVSAATAPFRTGRLVDGTGAINLIEAAVEAGVRSFVLESSIGVGDSRSGMPLWVRLTVLRTVLREKERAERTLRDSGLDYVVFRPGQLTDRPATNDVLLAEGGTTITGAVPRADVARLMTAAPFTPAAAGRTFEVIARQSLRGPARGLVAVEWNQVVHMTTEPSRD